MDITRNIRSGLLTADLVQEEFDVEIVLVDEVRNDDLGTTLRCQRGGKFDFELRGRYFHSLVAATALLRARSSRGSRVLGSGWNMSWLASWCREWREGKGDAGARGRIGGGERRGALR